MSSLEAPKQTWPLYRADYHYPLKLFYPASQNLVRASIAPTLQKAYIKKQVVSTLLDPSSFVRSDLLLTAGLRAGGGGRGSQKQAAHLKECDQRRTPRFSQGFYKYQLQETWREQ